MVSEIHCVIKGRVQGVGFRDFVENHARENALTGWIKNKHEDEVEVVLQGIPDELKICIEALHQGSPLSRVESLAVDWRTPDVTYDDFKILV